MAIRPTHTASGGLPRYFFVGRTEEISVFTRTLESDCAPDEYSILTISALGGQGKSSLLARMRQILKEEKYAEFPSASIDFDLAAQRDPINALLTLRNQFAAAGIKTNAFDIAFARHFVLTRPGRNIRTDHPELFALSGDLLGEVVDSLGDVITELPGAKLVLKIITKISQKGIDWLRKRGEPLLKQLDEIPPHDLRAELPMFLGADLSAYCADASNKRLVIFYDTHEALWRGKQRIDYAAETGPDSWLRRFVQETPRVLHVVAGRRPLDWPKIDGEWNKFITSIDLRELDTESAYEIFDKAALTSEPIRKRILEASQRHALTLRVNVRIYETLIGQGQNPTPDDFPLVAKEAFDRFFDHLDVNTRAALRALAIPHYIDNDVWQHLAKSGVSAFDLVSQKDVLEEVHFRKAEDGRYLMHELVRDGIMDSLAQSDPALFKRLHEAMFEFHNARLQQFNTPGSDISAEARNESLEEAADHLLAAAPERFNSWCVERLSTDLASIGAPGRQRLWDEARKQIGSANSANWKDLIRLAYIEARAQPFEDTAYELVKSTKPFWSKENLTADLLTNLREIVWLYKITGQTDRVAEFAEAVIAARSADGPLKHGSSYLLEALLAIERGDKSKIERELERMFDHKAGGETVVSWCLIAGILLTRNAQAITRLREILLASKSDTQVLIVDRILDVADQLNEADAGLAVLGELMSETVDGIFDRILTIDATPSLRYAATVHFVALAEAAGHEVTELHSRLRDPEEYADDWESWIDSNFVPNAVVASVDVSIGVHRREIEEIAAGKSALLGNVWEATLDLFIGNDGELCIFTDCHRLVWREIDYVAYHDLELFFFDARYGLVTFGVPIEERLRTHIYEGTNAAMISVSASTRKAIAGVEHPLITFSSTDQAAMAVNSSRNSTVH